MSILQAVVQELEKDIPDEKQLRQLSAHLAKLSSDELEELRVGLTMLQKKLEVKNRVMSAELDNMKRAIQDLKKQEHAVLMYSSSKPQK